MGFLWLGSSKVSLFEIEICGEECSLATFFKFQFLVTNIPTNFINVKSTNQSQFPIHCSNVHFRGKLTEPPPTPKIPVQYSLSQMKALLGLDSFFSSESNSMVKYTLKIFFLLHIWIAGQQLTSNQSLYSCDV